MSRLRAGYLSPLPPAASGIADYAAELLPALAEHLDPVLFTLPGLPAPEPALARRFPVHPWSELDRRAGDLDLLLYQVGNHPRFHGPLYAALQRHPGVVVLHEYVLHHMVREITLVAGRPQAYVEEMRYAYGDAGRALARRAVTTGVPVDPWSFPLFERVADCALGLLVHNRASRDRVLASRPGARVAVVPHHLSLAGAEEGAVADPEEVQAAARRRLDLPQDAFLVGAFGYQNRSKRLDVALAAFGELRRHHPEARFAVVGGVDPALELPPVEGVTRVGRVEELERFLDWMRAVDVAVNLRHPTAGETSGTVIRLLGLGKPLLVTDAGSFAEIPPGCAARVPVDPRETARVAALLVALAGDPALRRDLGESARRHARRHHALEASADGYARFLAAVVADPRRPAAPAPPLAPPSPDDLLTELAAGLAAEAVDLGVVEGDDQEDILLPDLASLLVDVDLDRFALPPADRAGKGEGR